MKDNETPAGTAAVITDADFSEIRRTTIAAHEAPSLFELTAGDSQDSDAHEDFEDDGGTPVSAYSSPLALWEMKTGNYAPTGSGNRSLWSRIKFGVITGACENNGLEVRRTTDVHLHPEMTFMSSRIDMEADDGSDTWIPVVAYNVAGVMIDSWRNATGDRVPPESVQLEAHHHMAVRGCDRIYVVAFMGGVESRLFVIERDDDVVAEVCETVAAFWERVTSGQRPDHSGRRDADALSRLCANIDPDGPVLDLRNDTQIQRLLEQKSELSKTQNDAKKKIDEINAELKSRMTGVTAAIISDTQQISWDHTPEKEISFTRKASYTLRQRKISKSNAGRALTDLVDGAQD